MRGFFAAANTAVCSGRLSGYAVLGLIWLALAGAALAQGFLPGSEDIPLAPGLTAREDDTVVFDSPTGRIVEVFATGETDRAGISTFYEQTLPALGWSQIEDGVAFRREGERLTLDFFGADGALTIRFTLAPA